MTRSELVMKIAEQNPDLRYSEARKVVDAIFETICQGLARGDRIELRGFGTFSARHRDRGQRRNPRTGEIIVVGAKSLPFFKVNKGLHERLNPK